MHIAKRLIKKSFTRQIDQSDCAVACLLSIIKYYDGSNTIENIRNISGTSVTGTTLLGLYQAAIELGFNAEGCESDIDTLTKYDAPCILYTNLNHYVVFYGLVNATYNEEAGPLFVIGDPAQGIITMDGIKLAELWKTRKCLALLPNMDFKRSTEINRERRKWAFDLLKEDFPLLGIAAGLGAAIALLGLALAIFSQRLIDEILPNRDFHKLYLGVLMVFGLLFIKECLAYIRQYFLYRQSKDFNIRIIDFFFSHLLQLPKSFFDFRKIGDLTARLNDTSRIQRVVMQLIGNGVIDFLVVATSIVLTFKYSWQVGFLCLILLPLFFALIYVHNNKIKHAQQSMMSNYANSEGNYISTLQGIEPIKNLNKQELFAKINKMVYKEFQKAVFDFGKIQIKITFLANVFGVLFLAIILLYGGTQVLQHRLKAGELMALLGLTGALLPGVANLALISIVYSEAKVAFDRMFEFTSVVPESLIRESSYLTFNTIQVRNLSFRFIGRGLLLKDVNFEIQKGDIVAIMGENGCGKSTLSQILQKNLSPEGGTIIINDGMNLSDIPIADWRQKIGVVPQHVHIFNGTILENIAFEDASQRPDQVIQFLREYGFFELLDTLPQSVLTLIGEEGVNISGGQKQIIALARTLYQKPEFLILDEATAAMDRNSELFVLGLMGKLKNDMAILFITHRLHILKNFCNKICILREGLIANEGNHNQLLKSNNIYSQYWADLVD